MRRTFLLFGTFFCLIACGTKPVSHDGDPVDGPYTVRLSALHETCYDLDKPEGTAPFIDKTHPEVTVEIDAFLRDDGLIDLKHSSSSLPGFLPESGEGMIPSIDRAGGVVDQFRHVAGANSTTSVSSKGRFTPDMLSLDFVDTYDDGSTYCTFTTHAEGIRRPLTDMADPDGIYVTNVTIWNGCPASVDDEPTFDGVMRISAATTSNGELGVTLDEGILRFTIPMPGEDGAVDHEGDVVRNVFAPVSPEAGSNPVGTGRTRGTFSPESVALDLTFATEESAAAGCGSIIAITGQKMQPRRDAIVGDYRMMFDLSGDCLSAPRTETGIATVMDNGDGTFQIIDFGGPFDVTLDNGHFDDNAGDITLDGFTATFVGNLDPPFLDYRIEQTESTYHGFTCDVVIEAHGETRYVF